MQSVFVNPARWLLMAAGGLLAFGLLLNALAAQENDDDFDPGALAFERDTTELLSSPVDILSLASSADGRFLAAGGGTLRAEGGSGRVRVWDFTQGMEIISFPTDPGVVSVAIAPDAKRIAWASWAGDIWLREVRGAELMHQKFDSPTEVAFSPDGQLLVAATQDGLLRAWDGATGKPSETFEGETFPLLWVGFSPDGKYLVTCGGKSAESESVKIAVWDVATRRQLYKLTNLAKRVFGAAISPDSQTLAVGSRRLIELWDLPTGILRSRTQQGRGPVVRIEFSPDGSLLAAAAKDSNDGVVTLWNSATGMVTGTLKGEAGFVRALAFARDGQTLVTGGSDRTIRMWNIGTRQQSGVLQEARAPFGLKSEILALAYSPDGTCVATAEEDGRVSIVGLAPVGSVRSWMAHDDAVAALAFSPDGMTLVSGGYDKTVKLWNVASGELIRSLDGHAGWVVSLAFSHDGQTLASGSYDRSTRLWNLTDGMPLRTLTGHTATVRSLDFSHDDKILASGGADHTVRLWDPASGQEQATLTGHEGGLRSVAFSSDDRLLASGGEDRTIKVWNVGARDLRGTLTAHTDTVSAVAFAGKTLISTSWDGKIRTWDADALEARSNFGAGQSPLVALAVDPQGQRLLTAGADRALALWKPKIVEGKPTKVLGRYHVLPSHVIAAFSPDGNSVVLSGAHGNNSDITLYSLASMPSASDPMGNSPPEYNAGWPGILRAFAFAPAGDLLALGFANGPLLLVEAATGRQVAQLPGKAAEGEQRSGAQTRELTFSPDGKLLAVEAADHAIALVDVERREVAKTLSGHTNSVMSIAFSPNQNEMFSGSRDKTAIVWNLASGEKRIALPAQSDEIAIVAWSPDGKTLATGTASGMVSLWEAQTGLLRRTRLAHRGSLSELRFSPDSKLLATCGADRLVTLWDVATGDAVQSFACHAGPTICLEFAPDAKSFTTVGHDGISKQWSVVGSQAN